MCSREILRKTISPSQNPVLWASTYDAGEVLRKLNLFPSEQIENIVIRGFLAQSALIYSQIEAELSKSNEDKKILLVQGVHLTLENILRFKQACGCCIPFIIFVSDKDNHRKRFSSRTKNNSLDPAENRYVRYFENIRCISDYLCSEADNHSILRIDNLDIEESLEKIISTITIYMNNLKQESYDAFSESATGT